MESLRKERRVIRLNVNRVKDQLTKLIKVQPMDVETLSKVEALLDMDWGPLKDRFDNNTNKMLDLLEDEEDAGQIEKLLTESDEIRNINMSVHGKVKSFRRLVMPVKARESLLPSPSDLNASFSMPSSAQPRLKRIDVPTFDGNLRDFYNFKSLFENLVHNNVDLSNVQKLYYLKQSLVGAAECIVRDFELKDSSYAEAWAHVLSRFENRRAIIRAYFRELKNLQVIKNESGIRKLLDQVDALIRGLNIAGEKVETTFSRFIAFHISTCLDPTTLRDWENSLTSCDSFPTYEDLQKFLRVRSFSIEERNTDDFSSSAKELKRPPFEKKSINLATSNNCIACNQMHLLIECKKFATMKPLDRFALIKKHALCLNCFNRNHVSSQCSRLGCKNCGKKHHSLLHFDREQPEKAPSRFFLEPSSSPNSAKETPRKTAPSTISETTKSSNICFHPSPPLKTILLPTAVVRFRCGGASGNARILLDSCSQPTLISDKFIRQFRLPTYKSSLSLSVSGVGGNVVSNLACAIKLSSRFRPFSLDVLANVVPSTALTYNVKDLSLGNVGHRLKKYQLADTVFIRPSVEIVEVDLILGAEYFESCQLPGACYLDGPYLRETQFGWTVSGPVADSSSRSSASYTASAKQFCGLATQSIDALLEKFWSLEEATPNVSNLTSEEEECSHHFDTTHRRDPESGKFVIRLPFNSNSSKLVNNYSRALACWYRVEKSLTTELKEQYSLFLREYEGLGHMSSVVNRKFDEVEYYAPHRAVLRPGSTTTRVRVVFNASSKTRSGYSLNDALLKGPNIQPELFDILVGFRVHFVAFTADVEKMYRCIFVDPVDRRYQRIVWRSQESNPIVEYNLNTLTYGTKPASFIATKCLAVIANNLRKSDPESVAASFIDSCFYMDDLLAGADSVGEAIQLQLTIHRALIEAGFPLRKYQSNSESFLSSLSLSTTKADPIAFDHSDSISVLGIIWDPKSDCFSLSCKLPPLAGDVPLTKRLILAEISRIFDPLGLVAPVSIRAKILLQSLWREQLSWDTPVPESLHETYKSYREELGQLEDFHVQRRYSSIKANPQLIGFADASERAYCAVVYLRTVGNNSVAESNLVCAKTRVAPLKPITIPKLELLAAVLLAKLLDRVRSKLKIDLSAIAAFSDSTVVLGWMRKPLAELPVFERNRVSQIVNDFRILRWSYINTAENPADLATRGISASQLIASQLWLHGPSSLSTIDVGLPDPVTFTAVNTTCALPRESSFGTVLLARFSSYTRLIHSVAYIRRWLKSNQYRGELSSEEINIALRVIIRVVQREAYGADPTQAKSLVSLLPFADKVGVIRIRGRLDNAPLSYDKRHPIVLPASSRFVELYIRHIHCRYYHTTQSFTVNFIRQQFWVTHGLRRVVKKVVRTCTTCIRHRAETFAQVMGDLPIDRVTPARPFTTSGVDFMGPFLCKCLNHRSVKHTKIYAAMFVCFVTRAVHVEVVSSLSTEAFLDCLKRFISRRGVPSTLYSDNATNFVGANNVLTNRFAADTGFSWKFIPPRSPNFGGLWESAVKSAKHHLSRSLAGSVGTLEQYTTFLCQIEAILNSRPLCTKRDHADSSVITPAHFLVGDSLLSSSDPEVPIPETIKIESLLLSYQTRLQSFWKFWRNDYLAQLQSRSKWSKGKSEVVLDTVVILKEDNLPPSVWRLGRVVQLYPDSNGVVRVVDVATASSRFRRSVRSLVPLPRGEC